MAHIYKPNCKCPDKKKCRCGAKWAYIVDVGVDPKTGKRRQKKKSGFDKKTDAEKAAAKIVVDLAAGKKVVTKKEKILFKDFADLWLEEYKTKGKKKKKRTLAKRTYEKEKIVEYFMLIQTNKITADQYQFALNDLKNKGYSDNTISGIHCTAKMIFKKAKRENHISENPTEYAVLPQTSITIQDIEQGTEIPKYLEKEELGIFIRIARRNGLPLDYEMFKLLAFSGLRIGEACALKWSDLDFTENSIRITKTYYNEKNNTKKYELITPKTLGSIRTIEMDPTVMEELKLLKIKQEKFIEENKNVYHDEDFVFVNMEKFPGYPFMTKYVENRMIRLLKIANLDHNLTPHSLRHTHTSLLAEAGVSLQAIMQRLGHVKDDTTERIYLHVTKPVKKDTTRKFSRLMSGVI